MSYIDPNDRPAPSFDPIGEPPKKRRAGGIVVAAALVVVFGVGVWYAYSQGVQKGGNLVPPLIKADNAPVKVAPQNPGGMQVPNQDKAIYDSMQGANKAPKQAEKLLPPPEQPKPEPPAPPKPPAAASLPMPSPAAGGPAMPAVPQTPVVAQPASPPPGAPPVPSPAALEVPKGATAPQTASLPSERIPPAGPAIPAPASAPKAVASVPPPPQAAAGGNFRIQLGSLGEQAAADAEWKRISRSHSDVLGGLPYSVEKVEIPNIGTRYRIQAGAFADRATATAVCDRLKAKDPKQGCIVAAR